MVIFGASGDLTRRKLMPALWRLFVQGNLPRDFSIIGYSRSEKTEDQFRDEMHDILREANPKTFNEERWGQFAARLSYVPYHYDKTDDYVLIEQKLRDFEEPRNPKPIRIFYLATPPSVYEQIIGHVAHMSEDLDRAAGLPRGRRDVLSRVVIEKPHGRNLAEARRINDLLDQHFGRDGAFRIDHYTGKETVQNILVLRFANAIFEPLWNRKYISYVEITAAETLGVGTRGKLYEELGAVRDMVQMHLLHLLTFVAMEQPVSFASGDISDEKAKVLRLLRPITPDQVFQETVRGQYGPGQVNGQEVLGYRQEVDVPKDSSVETYAALRVYVDSWRWQGVPFYLRTGKRLERYGTEIAVHFQSVPICLFGNRELCARIEENDLVMRIQPHEGVHLRLASKVPGETLNVGSVRMDFDYADVFNAQPAEAYETLLLDVMLGDNTLFARRDQVELSWGFVQPILDLWADTPAQDFPNYAAGSRGPQAASALLAQREHAWHDHGKADAKPVKGVRG
jgi:glucose-6-phosphate 1-dehydrogenase